MVKMFYDIVIQNLNPIYLVQKQTSICLVVFATSSGPVVRVLATKSADKFAPITLTILGSSPILPKSVLLVCR